MADIAVQDITDEDGATVTFTACAGGGDKFVYDPRAMIVVRNRHATDPQTVTVTPSQTVIRGKHGELTRSNIAIAVAATDVAIIPPLPDVFRWSADSNKVRLTYSGVTDLWVGIVKT